MSKILITGSSGLLGAHLMAAFSQRHEVVGIDRHPWWGDRSLKTIVEDLASATAWRHIRDVAPDILVHCAALVNVDACEQDPALAYALNAQLTKALVRAVPAGCLVVYISTDGVFKGDAPNATETDLPCPRTIYARSKLQGEWEVALGTDNHLIVRTNFYGWSSGRKQTAAEWLHESLASGAPIVLFDDFYFSPIYVVDLVQRLVALLESRHRGLLHLCGADRVSKYAFGGMMAKAAGFSMANVQRGSLEEARLPAPRPKDMSLDSSEFHRLTGMDLPGCLEGLQRFLEDRDRPLSARLGSRREPLVVSP
ncbi:MAG: SDR family oxidoreductase [Candidatus Omnitrophica bacterium]|nr:SDR family oxidoreductase [Candidatus Omnitrophota bacterium]